MQLGVYHAILPLIIMASYLLLFDSENILFIYLINSKPQVLYQTNQFQHYLIKIYSLASSFFIIDGQLFQIDIDNYSFELHKVGHLNFACHSLFSVSMSIYWKSFISYSDFKSWFSFVIFSFFLELLFVHRNTVLCLKMVICLIVTKMNVG